jgi:pimeloyl-ACP methyl ester carboxylesterase
MKAFINNANIAYSDHGMGLPVIFLHAFPLNRGMWEGDIAALLQEQRYRLVSLDWRGFGESEIPNDISTMELFADDAAGLMDYLGIEKAVLCGLSMGGYAAFTLLRSYPQRLAGLILTDF